MLQFAKRTELLKGSEIRELLKVATQPDMISFAGGMPAPELFPVEEMRESAKIVLRENGRAAMQYSSTEGHPPLREQICRMMKRRTGLDAMPDEILITAGSQQGLDFAARTFLDPGDVILLETPSYVGAVNAFRVCEPVFMGVETDEEGMVLEDLERILKTTERVKLIYVIPNFQNPTGRTWSLQRRKGFMELIEKYEIPVIEDNPYGDLIFEGKMLPTLKSMDPKGLVIYLGSFSKILCPGYRLGWTYARPDILSKFNFMEQAASLQASTIGQMEVAKYLELYDIDKHIEEICELYGKRCKLMMKLLDEHLPKGCSHTNPRGGLFTWVVLPEGMNAKELQLETLKHKVAFVPGGGFFPNGGHDNTVRLNYSCMPEDKIEEGIKIFCECIRDFRNK